MTDIPTFASADEAATFLRQVGAPPPGILSFRNWARLARMRPSSAPDVVARIDVAERMLESVANAAAVSGCRRVGDMMLCSEVQP